MSIAIKLSNNLLLGKWIAELLKNYGRFHVQEIVYGHKFVNAIFERRVLKVQQYQYILGSFKPDPDLPLYPKSQVRF